MNPWSIRAAFLLLLLTFSASAFGHDADTLVRWPFIHRSRRPETDNAKTARDVLLRRCGIPYGTVQPDNSSSRGRSPRPD